MNTAQESAQPDTANNPPELDGTQRLLSEWLAAVEGAELAEAVVQEAAFAARKKRAAASLAEAAYRKAVDDYWESRNQ